MITFHILPRKPRLLKLHVLWPPNQSIQRHHYRSCYSHVSTSLPATFRYQLAIDHNLSYSGEHQNSCMILHVHSRNAIAYVPLCHGENTVYGLDRSPSHIGNPRYKNHYRLMTLMTIPKYGDRIYINLPGDHDISWSIPISWDHCKSCLDPQFPPVTRTILASSQGWFGPLPDRSGSAEGWNMVKYERLICMCLGLKYEATPKIPQK